MPKALVVTARRAKEAMTLIVSLSFQVLHRIRRVFRSLFHEQSNIAKIPLQADVIVFRRQQRGFWVEFETQYAHT